MQRTKLIIALFLIPQIVLVNWVSNYPELIETYYSRGLYPKISAITRFTFGYFPFSFGDILYIGLVILGIRWLIVNWFKIRYRFRSFIISVFAIVSLLYFSFYLLWGLNYFRQPLHEQLGLKSSYTTEDLIKTTEVFITKSNRVQLALTGHIETAVEIPYTNNEIYKKIANEYSSGNLELNSEQSVKLPFKYIQKSVKSSLLSLPLTYMGFSGYLNPITNEAQVNKIVPKLKIPTITAHEIAHQLGYSAENEANFLAYSITAQSANIYFQYASHTFALQHCLQELYRRNPNHYNKLIKNLHPGVIKNFNTVKMFWSNYKNPLEPLIKLSYNGFLKANKQAGGIKSYNYVVALIVNSNILKK